MASLRLIETHSKPDHLPDNLRLAWEPVDFGSDRRSRVRLHNEQPLVNGTPATAEPIAVLNEIDGLFEFVRGLFVLDRSLCFINLDKRTGPNNWMHRPIFGTDEGIAMGAQIERLQ